MASESLILGLEPGDFIAVLALLIAGYGAVLSTLNARREGKRDRPELTVHAWLHENIDGSFDVQVRATNSGHRRLLVDEVLFYEPTGKAVRLEPIAGHDTPQPLDPGDSLMQFFHIHDENNPRTNLLTVTDNFGNAWDAEIEVYEDRRRR